MATYLSLLAILANLANLAKTDSGVCYLLSDT